VLDTDHPAFGPKPEYWLDSYIFNAGRNAIKTVIAGGIIQVDHGRHKSRDRVAARFRQSLNRVL
jgi:hypothetical protein